MHMAWATVQKLFSMAFTIITMIPSQTSRAAIIVADDHDGREREVKQYKAERTMINMVTAPLVARWGASDLADAVGDNSGHTGVLAPYGDLEHDAA